MEKIKLELSLVELSELLQWADYVYTKNLMATTGGELSDRLWKLYKERKSQEN